MGFPRKTLRTLNSIFSETVNVKKLANLTANNKDYGQITLNATQTLYKLKSVLRWAVTNMQK